MSHSTTSTDPLANALQLPEVQQLGPKNSAPMSVEEIADQVQAQLAEPLGFPPLAKAIVPGDRIAVAVAPGIPQQAAVIDGTLKALIAAKAESSLITILVTDSPAQAEALASDLTELGHPRVRVQAHNANKPKELAFLGVSTTDNALRLNRELCDADFVLPILPTTGSQHPLRRCPQVLGLFPTFSDEETIERFSMASAKQFPEISEACQSEIEDCHRQLGVLLCLHVVPSSGNRLASVLAGDPTIVATQAQAQFQEIWQVEIVSRGELVIATLSGSAEHQSWQAIGRALTAAEAVLEPGGAIAIHSQISVPPQRALSQLFEGDDYDLIEREILRTLATDNGVALLLCRRLRKGPVFLISQLPAAVVEGLGITPLDSDDQLQRLIETHRPCVLLEDADKLLPLGASVETEVAR